MARRTLIIVKPDAVQRGFVGTVISAFKESSLVIRALKTMVVSPDLAERHYGIHKGKPSYQWPDRFHHVGAGGRRSPRGARMLFRECGRPWAPRNRQMRTRALFVAGTR